MTYYCDPTRPDDSGDGLSAETAKRTLAAGLALLGPDGDELEMAIGTYPVYSVQVIRPLQSVLFLQGS